jgi:signal recognition particle subunit SRP19
MTQPQAPMPEPQREIPKHFQCLYPVYFDKTRSRTEGRKVGAELAVENPLARDIVDAVQMLGLKAGLEPEKLHPKDWANPGRVRVMLKDENGQLVNSKIKNSKLLNSSSTACELALVDSNKFFDYFVGCS